MVDKESLKKIYNDGFFVLDSKEWELLYNSLTVYKDKGFNDITMERIDDLRGKILMLYGKENPKIFSNNKILKKFMDGVLK